MFTGIVKEMGRITGLVTAPRGGRQFEIGCRTVRRGLHVGDSVSVGGVCLTVATLSKRGFKVQAVPETLRLTTLGQAHVGDLVNLEGAARLNEVVGGHLVSGHVDGLGKVVRVAREGNGLRLAIETPPAVARYLVHKGSVCVDGVSLTIAALRGRRLEIALIPHTVKVTTIGRLAVGQRVNLEADLIAKHVAALLKRKRG